MAPASISLRRRLVSMRPYAANPTPTAIRPSTTPASSTADSVEERSASAMPQMLRAPVILSVIPSLPQKLVRGALLMPPRLAIPAANVVAGNGAVGTRTSGGLEISTPTAPIGPPSRKSRARASGRGLARCHQDLAARVGRELLGREVLLEDLCVGAIREQLVHRAVDRVEQRRVLLVDGERVLLAGGDLLSDLEVGLGLHDVLGDRQIDDRGHELTGLERVEDVRGLRVADERDALGLEVLLRPELAGRPRLHAH